MRESTALLEQIVASISRHKAFDVEVLEVRDLVGYCDYFVICSGHSTRQVEAIALDVIADLKKEHVLPLGVEGLDAAEWVLVDFNDVVLHLFHEPVRRFYDLESLWREAPRVPVVTERAVAAAAP